MAERLSMRTGPDRPAWWIQRRTFRVVWALAASGWLALAGIIIARPSGLSVSVWLAALALVVAVLKAAVLVWTNPRRRPIRILVGAAVAGLLTTVVVVEPTLATVEFPALACALGISQFVLGVVVWRR